MGRDILKEIEDFVMVKYRIREEGIEYTFKHYSSFPEIEDEEFHRKRMELVKLMNDMDEYLTNKLEELEDEYINTNED
jgi:hypothetical protein